jgi:hypothetical protein
MTGALGEIADFMEELDMSPRNNLRYRAMAPT